MAALETREIFDISPVISHRTAVFPGDVPFSESFLLEMTKGHNLTLSSMTTTMHVGAHTDAPSHYRLDGQTMEQRRLDLYLGSAQVIEVTVPRGTRIRPGDLKQPVRAPRVLFRTGSFPDPDYWNGDFVALSAELVDFLAAAGVRLVGIDTPSIDPADDKVLESHRAVARHDMGVLEGIVLTAVSEGLYDLIALPLRIEGADGSPVRAILLR